MNCPKCGRKVVGDVCFFCGTPIKQEVSSDKSEDMAAVSGFAASDPLNESVELNESPELIVESQTDARDRSYQGYNVEETSVKRKKSPLFFLLAMLVVVVVLVVALLKIGVGAFKYFEKQMNQSTNTSNNTEAPRNSNNNTNSDKNSNSAPYSNSNTNTNNNTNTYPDSIKKDPVVGVRTTFTDMKLGEIGKSGGVYCSLNYVKRMSYLPTALGKETVASDKEVIIGFFEFYNHYSDPVKADIDAISCYVDGVKVKDVQTYIKVVVDGINQQYTTDLDNYCKLITCQDFEVTKGWKEIKFYYNSQCYWTISNDDVKTEKYNHKTAFDIETKRPKTAEGTVIYQGTDGYTITYKGISYHKTRYHNYSLFLFEIKNVSGDSLNTSLMGYSMKAYADNYLLDDADLFLRDTINGYVNIFDVDSIEPGMTAKIYIAFETEKKPNSLYLIYDDGYITNKVRGKVYDEFK